ncbi:MAG: hypothetical protein FRX48_00418 [Lasallia pustulata]|uniref:CID domain-containing protein n=1 Tax=Lasallia pustulata TaxID=136370 RepID=A0A5M8Q2Q5_9LECA|nr:MAG: hypothetical protein FRX48_00418 [Lasallia pustulata]
MAQESKIKEFPDIGTKLTAPTKKSVFERQKAEAEAKRQREQAETAAVYEDFVKSFDDTDGTLPSAGAGSRSAGGSGGPGGSGGFGGPSKRHFTGPPTGPASGRGGLGGGRGSSGPGSLGPPPSSLSRKRGHDGLHTAPRESSQGLFAFEDSNLSHLDAKSAFQNSDDEEEVAGRTKAQERSAPKPTIHMSSLPPGTSPAVIKSIIPLNLGVDAVRLLPPSGPGTTERKSLSAIVTLAKDTPAIDIDTAVSALQNRYLGWGFYLSLSRHLSSAAVGAGVPIPGGSSGLSSLPFGARPVPTSLGRAPPPGSHRGGFAPPSSYAPSGPGQFGRGAPLVHVKVNPPSDLKELKLIHKTLEALLLHGPEFEALLMSRSDVQRDEKWAWLWDPRSAGGVWYRWRLWDILTGAQQRSKNRGNGKSQFVFDGGAAWTAPDRGLVFEYATELEEFVSDPEYDSSEDDESGDEGQRRPYHHQGGPPPPDALTGTGGGDGRAYLNPLKKAKLTHLLARLPTTNARLRRGDVARITAFAIQHAGEGGEEVVDMITSNVQYPFNFTTANLERKTSAEDAIMKDEEEGNEEEKKSAEKEDTSSSKLIALYIISDILSSSSTSGVRHAWRYRQLFEAALKQKRIFEGLGRLEKNMQWGRLRAEKWKRSVGSVLTLWEGWCVFPQSAQEHFAAVFANPPLTAAEEAANAAAEKASEAAMAAKSKWKTVDEKARQENSPRPDLSHPAPTQADDDVDMDLDGEPMADDGEDDDIDGEPMGDVDGEPMEDDEDSEAVGGDDDEDAGSGTVVLQGPLANQSETDQTPAVGFQLGARATNSAAKEPTAAASRRRRPRAEDMFADSDDD